MLTQVLSPQEIKPDVLLVLGELKGSGFLVFLPFFFMLLDNRYNSRKILLEL